MYKNINSAEYSLMLILSYDLYMYTKISDSLVEFIEKRIRSKWKLGARSLNPDSTLKMEMINRDLPGRDLENLILSSKGDTLKDSVYDVSINSLKGFSEDYTQKIMLIIIGENPVEGSSSLKDMHLITDQGIKLFVIAREGVLSDEFEKFMENTMCTLIEFGESQSFAKALQYFYGKV